MAGDLDAALGFSDEEIAACLARDGLLSLELEFTRRCNLRCLYCYAAAGTPLPGELSLPEVLSVVEQAAGLGARTIVLLGGGEPLLWPFVREVVRQVRRLGMAPALFTNGVALTEALCGFLAAHEVTVAVKQNSLRAEVQDALAGVAGAHADMQRGLRRLMAAGYPDERRRLCVQTVICRQNREELVTMWSWARERGITPYFEVLTDQGRARRHPDLALAGDEIRGVFEELAAVDARRFGRRWTPRPPIAAFTCRRHLYSCLVTATGIVQPCPGIDLAVGQIRERPLEAILRTSAVIRDLRQIYARIDEECRA
ncbi:MAG TPA: radical SAM protein, partial [Candidatus Sulfotelmatobacter sp.]|nr:radical SAM protein [Candidatus Sulfotelmatobacter sp.]